jgi:hypothetical protein
MENFPDTFVATKIQIDVTMNRRRKIELDMKRFREKIVKSFEENTVYHAEVSHRLLPDLSDDEQKECYAAVKKELEDRGFTVRGKLFNNAISMVIFSNSPRTNEMDKVLKQYSEKEGLKTPPDTGDIAEFSAHHRRTSGPVPPIRNLHKIAKQTCDALNDTHPGSEQPENTHDAPVVAPSAIKRKAVTPRTPKPGGGNKADIISHQQNIAPMSTSVPVPVSVSTVAPTVAPVPDVVAPSSEELDLDFIRKKLNLAKPDKRAK